MDDLLTDGDFNDFAAAVGEGGDGSDDDARVRWTGTHTAYENTAENTFPQHQY